MLRTKTRPSAPPSDPQFSKTGQSWTGELYGSAQPCPVALLTRCANWPELVRMQGHAGQLWPVVYEPPQGRFSRTDELRPDELGLAPRAERRGPPISTER